MKLIMEPFMWKCNKVLAFYSKCETLKQLEKHKLKRRVKRVNGRGKKTIIFVKIEKEEKLQINKSCY